MQDPEANEAVRLSRRDVLALGAGAFVVGLVPFARARSAQLVRRSFPVMGTLAEIVVVGCEGRRAHAAIDAAAAELRLVHRLMTPLEVTSDVGRANLGAAREAVAIRPETAEVLAEGLRIAEASDGRFDPCLGRAIALWDVSNRREPPPDEALRAVAGQRLHRALELDRWRGGAVVRFRDRDVALDLGGIAKGYGVDRAVAALRAGGVERALVNAGGDLAALGRSEDGDPWRVGVRSPEDPSRVERSFAVADAAVATSGDYFQFFEYRGRRYHHLIDPRTGAPRRTSLHSVTVVADTCAQADAAATAVFGLARPEAERLLAAVAPEARIVSPG